MLREMRPSELVLWRALWVADPWDEQRADLRQAQTSLAIAMGTLKKSRGQKWGLKDFMPYIEKVEKSDIDMLRERFADRIQKGKK